MLLVLLCPYAVFKFVHWASEGADAETIHRAGGTGAMVARQHTERAARKAAAMSAGAAGGTSWAGSPQGPSQIPGQGSDGIARINPTGGSRSSGGSGVQGQETGSSGSPDAAGLAKAVQPHPTSPADGTSQQPGGTPVPPNSDWTARSRPPTGAGAAPPPASVPNAVPPPPPPTGS
jgi:hypothetical protein